MDKENEKSAFDNKITFKADQPIESCKNDILGRASFAQTLGEAILNYKEKDSVVIGLFGNWGSGKTSIINMALEHIEQKDKSNDKKPIIIKFNPWNYSDQNQLVAQFFKQLSVDLKQIDYADNIKKAGNKLKLYAEILEPFALIPTIGSIASIFSKIFKSTGSAAISLGELKSNDLNTIKTKINELLGKLHHKIIIVIDDIDRLNNTEIRQIFQLVKSLGDFKNTIYLLAFDKNVVINALKKVQEGSGVEYLEKAIQIPFEVPLISKQEVEKLLFSQLNELIKDIPENRWDKYHWDTIYSNGLKDFFRNIRDVIRYMNSLRFGFEIINKEVNAIDFFAITAIQVFIPELYDGIKNNKDIFLYTNDDLFKKGDATIKDQAKKRLDEIIGRANEPSQEVLKKLLKKLFPKLEYIYPDNPIFGNVSYTGQGSSEWRKDCRICSPDIFDIFFRLSLPEGEISQEEIKTILSLGNDPNSFTEALLGLNKDGRIIRFLDRLNDYIPDIPEENVKPIIAALMDIGDLISDIDYYSDNTPMRLYGLFFNLSHRFKSHEERFNIFKHAIEKATRSLHTIVYEIALQGQQHGKYGPRKSPQPDDNRDVSSEQLKELENLACNKIESWANDGRLLTKQHRHLPFILAMWKDWGQQNKVDNFVKNMIKNDDGLIDFITSFLRSSTQSILSYDISDGQVYPNDVEQLVNLQEVEPRLRKIFSSPTFEQLNNKKQLAIKTFLDNINKSKT